MSISAGCERFFLYMDGTTDRDFILTRIQPAVDGFPGPMMISKNVILRDA
jgi:hypothetical protein